MKNKNKNNDIIKEIEKISKIRKKIKQKFIKFVKKLDRIIEKIKVDDDFYVQSEIFSDCGHTLAISGYGITVKKARGEEVRAISIDDISIGEIVELIKILPNILKDIQNKIKEEKEENKKIIKTLNKILKVL